MRDETEFKDRLQRPSANDSSRANQLKNLDALSAERLRNAYRELSAWFFAIERAYGDAKAKVAELEAEVKRLNMFCEVARGASMMLKSENGARQILLCGWCKKEMLMKMGELRDRVKNSANPLCCSVVCAGRLQGFERNKASGYTSESMIEPPKDNL